MGANHYYVSKDTLPLRELLWSDRTKVIDGKNMRYHSKPFTGLLAYYTLDCPALREDIFKLTEALDVGFKYQLPKVAFTLIAEMKTRYVVQRYAITFLFGLTYNLR